MIMYNFRYDRSKDHILIKLVMEGILNQQRRLFEFIKEYYNKKKELRESLSAIENDFNEYCYEFGRLIKEKGGKFKIAEVADNLPGNTWPKISKLFDDIEYGPNRPGSIPLNELPKDVLLREIEHLNKEILERESMDENETHH
jgi:hypothetical protein